MQPNTDIHNGQYHFFYKSPLSNFNIAPFKVFGVDFICGEQALHWYKSVFFGDDAKANEIMGSGNDPANCLKLGREVKNYDNPKWAGVRENISYVINTARFKQVEAVRSLLLSTDNKILVEASPIDRIYGIGYSVKDAPTTPVELWGDNMLGRVLTRIKIDIQKDLV